MEYIALSIPLFFLLMGLEFAWSAWKGRGIYRFNDLVANLGCGVGSQVVGAFTKTMIFAVYLWIYDHWRIFTLGNSVVTWIATFLLVDLLYYWFHRLSHEVNFLWAAHIVHHQSEEYNLSVALRQSWWQGLFSFWFYAPVAVLGVHPVTILTVGAFVTLYQFWIHTKALGRLGPLEWVFNTPSHHRVHHGSDPKYIDRNHAGTLIVWDKLFGTFQQEEEEPVYGITTPLRTWDPLRANFHYWSELIDIAGRCDRWQDKFRIFLNRPGWLPQHLGGPRGPVAKDRTTYRKFDTTIPRSWTALAGIQFVLMIIVTAWFLFRHQTMSTGWQWAVGALILWWVMELGVMMDGQRWVLVSAMVRSLLLMAVAGQFLHGVPLLLLCTVLALLMLATEWARWGTMTQVLPAPPRPGPATHAIGTMVRPSGDHKHPPKWSPSGKKRSDAD